MADDRVEAVERALVESAARSGLYKSTILRLIGSLEHFGYLRRREDGRYRARFATISTRAPRPGRWRRCVPARHG